MAFESIIYKTIFFTGIFFYKTLFLRSAFRVLTCHFRLYSKMKWHIRSRTLIPCKNSIPRKDGFALFAPGTIDLPHLNQTLEICQKIISEERSNQKIGKEYLHQLLTDQDLINYPCLLDFACSSQIISLVGNYLGETPILNQVKLLRSVKAGELTRDLNSITATMTIEDR
jgi:hypothetical protein